MSAKFTLDTRGLTCPLPALKLKLMLSECKANDEVVFYSTDKGVYREVEVFIEQYNLIVLESNEDSNSLYFRFIKSA